MKLKILSWNIWFDSPDFVSICKFLKESPADIVCLQEVSDDPKLDVISFMTKFGYNYVFTQAATANIHGKKYGNAIFSKYALTNKSDHVLSNEKSRNAIGTDIKIGNLVLHVFSTHLIHDHQQSSDIQKEQIQKLIKILPHEKTIVMGDFNATPESFAVQSMEKVLINTDPANTPTWSLYPEGCPVCQPKSIETRLDYIFVTRDIKVLSSKVEEATGSDHLPISAEIEI